MDSIDAPGRLAAGRPERVTLQKLRAVALRIADRSGAENLTIRGVARECGVTPMALYRHVKSVRDLQDLVVDEAVRGLLDEPPAGTWRDRITEMMERTRRLLLAHPGAASILNARATPVDEIVRLSNWYLGVLEEAGFKGEAVVQAFDALSVFLQGSVAFERTREAGARAAMLERPVGEADMQFLRKHRRTLTSRRGDAYFRTGVEALLDGLHVRLQSAEP